MTTDEVNRIEGKVNAQFRETRRTLAALRIEILEYTEKLKRASEYLRHSVNCPLNEIGDKNTEELFESVISQDIEGKISEYKSKSLLRLQLEQTLREFNNQ